MPNRTINTEPVRITIIGGGFCGTMTAINLMRYAQFPIRINLVNKGYPLAKGVAYAPHTSSLLLNVPNGRMSAYADMPDHYVEWLQETQPTNELPVNELRTEYSTREQYGLYLRHQWQEENRKQNNALVMTYHDYAIDITEEGSLLKVHLQDKHDLLSDHVILATGNAQPALPSGIHPSFCNSEHYFADPWKGDCMSGLSSAENLLIIGNGLTMADTVMGLTENGFTGQIYSVSPHGYQLKPAKEEKSPYPAPYYPAFINSNTGLQELLVTLNKHRKIAGYLNQSFYPAFDALRPYTHALWQSFSNTDKKRFISHLNHFWGNLRHRIPAQIHQFMTLMYERKKLITYKGRITGLKESDGQVDITLNANGVLQQLSVQRVINCTGPDTKLAANELLNNLQKRGLICPDVLNLGIAAHPDNGLVLNANGCKHNIFVIGANLKGTLWESTAVPELRVQAQKLAEHIVAEHINDPIFDQDGDHFKQFNI